MRVLSSSPELGAWVDAGRLTIGEAEKMLTGPAHYRERFFAILRKMNVT
jgi:hypothetical protein